MALPSPNKFVAVLFVFAICTLLIGGMNLVENIEYWRYAEDATMSLSDPNQERPSYTDDLSYTRRDIVMTSANGPMDMPQMMLNKSLAEKLDRGETFRVTYMTNNPKRVFYRGEKPEMPWVYLAVGFIFFGVAIYALRLRKREAAAA